MEALTSKGIQSLRSNINEMFKLFDAKPQTQDLDKAQDAFDVSKIKDSNPINEDMDLDFPDIDISKLADLDSLLPSGNWFDSLFKDDEVKMD